MSRRHVLLLEPNYRNKYPPMGLMKLAMYHRLRGDNVVFYKGDLSTFVISELTRDAVSKFLEIEQESYPNETINWQVMTPAIGVFIQKGKLIPDSELERALQKRPLSQSWLESFRKQFRTGYYYKIPRWDRVCVTTLFTFHWNLTIETIEFAKKVCKDSKQVLVGGILASVVPDKVEAATGIKPHVGSLNVTKLLNDASLPGPFGKMVIDALPLDYSILEEIDYRYPATEAYYAYATRGCVRKCAFCAVPKLEPNYQPYITLKRRLEDTRMRFGEKRHLLLLDNNAFASKDFDKIVDEIHSSGFAKGATFVPPNRLDIAVKQLRNGWNDRANIRLIVNLLGAYVEKLEGKRHDRYYTLLLNQGLLHDYTATKDSILTVYNEIKEDYEKERYKKPIVRHIDFNQGMDARLATPKKMAKLATIAINPLRIAFDNWAERGFYANAIRLAKENGISMMSNYLLYNYHDKPIDLYHRLRFNVDLCDALSVSIYSFPMKYHPIIDDKWFSNRDYVGHNWTRKAIRTIQAVLNSTAGKIGRNRYFFFKAFGRNETEFEELIRMPEAFIIKRWDAELNGMTGKWRRAYAGLNNADRTFVDAIIATNTFCPEAWKNRSIAVRTVLDFYTLEHDDVPLVSDDIKNRHIQNYEKSCSREVSKEVRKLLTNT